ncbi:MAG: prenyltransferase/squalene oxidase repeat-containing protein [Phycisphaerales bacterium]
MKPKTKATLIGAALAIIASPLTGQTISAEHREKADTIAKRAMSYLESRQNPETFGFDDDPTAQTLPAITGLVVTGFMLDPGVDERHPIVTTGTRYILKHQQPDGGIYKDMLPSYNTAICLSALALVNKPEALDGMLKGRDFLKTLQHHDQNTSNPEDPGFEEEITINHPYYGGVGYGKHGRPDLSNLSFFIQALHDTGVSTNDPAYQRALVFLNRVQMNDAINDMSYADGSDQGGFIYATVPNIESVDGLAGQSQAGTTTETLEDGSEIIRHRAYGSMTYAGFKSLIFANLAPDDPRMVAAWEWIENNYTLEENPGMGMQGYYFYLCTMARALDALGVDEINGRNWREDMIDTLWELQHSVGGFRVVESRWMENNDILIAAYALIAVQHAKN